MKYIERANIDLVKWNACIESSSSFVYARSWYLDEVCENWGGLVIEKGEAYEACFPVPWKSKFGIKYVYPPFFCQQLGLFTSNEDIDINQFVDFLSNNFKWVELYINKKCGNWEMRCNLVKKLDSSYEEIKSKYSKNHNRNLLKAKKSSIEIQRGNDVNLAINLFKTDKGSMFPHIGNDYNKFSNVCSVAASKGELLVLNAVHNQEVVCSAIFFVNNRRIIFSFSGNSEKGKELGALFLLLDYVIYENQNRDILLDFEGSEDEGLQRFYKGFGAKREDYYFLKINNLPYPFKLLKK